MQSHSLGGGIITGGSSIVGVSIHSKGSAFVRSVVGEKERLLSSKKDKPEIVKRNK